jgi:hypothetical protein
MNIKCPSKNNESLFETQYALLKLPCFYTFHRPFYVREVFSSMKRKSTEYDFSQVCIVLLFDP